MTELLTDDEIRRMFRERANRNGFGELWLWCYSDDFTTLARAIEAAVLAKVGRRTGLPAGWVAVPREPTMAMLQIAQDRRRDHIETPSMTVHESARRVWGAMLAVAPKLAVDAAMKENPR